jgi:hypothetical protein
MQDPNTFHNPVPRPRTEAQRRASRENGRHSTGAATPEGRRLASRAAISHGVYSHLVLLPTEDRQKFFDLRRRYYHHFCPQDEVLVDLVERMVAAKWRRMRLIMAESVSLLQEIERQRPLLPPDEPDAARTARALDTLARHGQSQLVFDRLHRRLTSEWDSAHDRFRRISGRNLPPPDPDFPAPPPAETKNETHPPKQPSENT